MSDVLPLRLFGMLRGTEPVLLVHGQTEALPRIAGLRVAAITKAPLGDRYGAAMLHDAAGAFAAAYGSGGGAWLVRPDGHVAWRGPSAAHPGLGDLLRRVFGLG